MRGSYHVGSLILPCEELKSPIAGVDEVSNLLVSVIDAPGWVRL